MDMKSKLEDVIQIAFVGGDMPKFYQEYAL